MKIYFLIIGFIFCFCFNLFSQVNLTLSPNPEVNGICPNVATTFTLNGVPSTCTFTLTSTGAADVTTTATTVTVTSADVPQNVVLTVTLSSSCDNQTKEFKIPVRSVRTEQPKLTGCPSRLVAGRNHNFTISAEHKYSFKGSSDPAEVLALGWSGGSTPGWSMTYPGSGSAGNSKTVNVVTDNLQGSSIMCTSRSHCGMLTSDPATCLISRYAEKPVVSPAQGFPGYLLCGQNSSFVLMASNPGLSGYNYTWNFGRWSGIGIGGSAIVQPTDNSANPITVTSWIVVPNGDTLFSDTTRFIVPVYPIDPATQVIGDQLLCSDESAIYKLTIPQEPSSVVSWAITPSNAVTPSSGVGEVTLLISANGYTGKAKVTFTINTPCGKEERSLDIRIGNPIILPQKIDGKQLHSGTNYVCPDDIGFGGAHYITLLPEGDDDGLIDYFQVTGAGSSWQGGTNHLNFTLQYNGGATKPPYDCVFIQAFASNECGTSSSIFIVCPSYWACETNPWFFKFSPNPTDQQTMVSLNFKDAVGATSTTKMEKIEVFDKVGNFITELEPESEEFFLNTANYPNGTYYIRTFIEGSPLMEAFIVEHGK